MQQLPEAMRFEPVAQVFKQLSDACRCRIFLLLCHSEECVINIAAAVKMSSPAVAHHLRLLRLAGLVTTRREGKEVFYRVADTELARSMHRMIEEVLHLSCTNQER
ncbi:MAG TPA: metalloregulator ArsR/SmtB family transcription factor [Candidatus Duodenibacillus intestinavium]|nr:metalloregulator ArsR/SmtB family transcription factor [Candidatus Duodenibacillus intestinavium]